MPHVQLRDVWFKFFPRDWRGDEQLQDCSLAARGLWIELLCLAHKADGYVKVNGMCATTHVISRAVHASPTEVRKLLNELVKMGVCSVSANGTMFSRRMVRDVSRRKVNQANGRKGGQLSWAAAFRSSKSLDPRSRSRSRSRNTPPTPLLGGPGAWKHECAEKHDSRCTNRIFHEAKMAEENS